MSLGEFLSLVWMPKAHRLARVSRRESLLETVQYGERKLGSLIEK